MSDEIEIARLERAIGEADEAGCFVGATPNERYRNFAAGVALALRTTRPHVLTKDCWCDPRVVKVRAAKPQP